MAKENWSNQETLNKALNIYRSAMRKFIVHHLKHASLDPKKAIKDVFPKRKIGVDIAACIDINDFPCLVAHHWKKVFFRPFLSSSCEQVTDKLQEIRGARNVTMHPPPPGLELEFVLIQLDHIIEVLELIKEADEVKKVSEIRDKLTTPDTLPTKPKPDTPPTQQAMTTPHTASRRMPQEPNGSFEPYPELKPELKPRKGPNEVKLHKALRIFRDAMSKFIVHHLGRVFVGNQVDAVKRELPEGKDACFEQRLKETGSIEAAIDIDDCRSLIQDCWDNPFAALFQNDSLILDTLSLITNGRNQIQHGTTDLESEYIHTQLFHIIHLLKCINALDQANRVSEIRDSLADPIKPRTDGLSKPNLGLNLQSGEAVNKSALHEALNIFRDTMSPFIVRYLYDEFVGNAEEAVKRALPKGRDAHFEQRLRETASNIATSIDINDFPYLVAHYWRDTFSKSFKNNPKILSILPTLRLITDGYNQATDPRTSDLEPEYVRAQLFHIIHLLKCINKPGQADKVSKFRNNLASLSTSPNKKRPDTLPTQEVAATRDTTSRQMPLEHPSGLPKPHPESKSALKNQEHLNTAALHNALNIFRDAMSPFIVHHLRHIFADSTKEAIKRVLPEGKDAQFEQRLKETGSIEACIDINDFPYLVRDYWRNAFSKSFKNNPKITNNLFVIAEGSNQGAHLGTSDLEQEFVRAQLFHIIDLLAHINKPNEAKAVAEIRDNLATPEVPPNQTGPDPSPTQEATATFDANSHHLKNQEHLNAAALHEALNIFRDTMSPFIVHHLGHVFDGNVENLIQRTLSKERSARFEQRLRKTGNIEASIDINDCCSLVQCYWNDIFSALFQDDSGILSTLSLIDDGSKQIAHPETPILDPEYVRIRLSHIADLLKRIEKPEPADAVLEIWDSLVPLNTSSPVAQPPLSNAEVPIPPVPRRSGFGGLSKLQAVLAVLAVLLIVLLVLALLFEQAGGI